MSTPQWLSNEIEDFQGGGLYPGGTGIVKLIQFQLWDYDGKQPKDSALAVHCKFQPTDGSGEGKEVEIYWSAGDASEYFIDPNGGRIAPTKARTAQSDNSNWAQVLKAFRDQCGLEKGKLSGEAGIRALEGSEVTFARVDQKQREGLAGATEKKNKPTMLIPTRARYAWEISGGSGRRAAQSASPSPSAPSASSNGAATPGTDIPSIIKAALAANGNSIALDQLSAKCMEQMTSVPRTQRIPTTKAIKEAAEGTSTLLDQLAAENNWEITDTHLNG